jgi:hypothetical protein
MSDEHEPPRSTREERLGRWLKASEATTHETPEAILYSHTVFCQTGLPYRNPGAEVTTWERINGRVHLAVMAGRAMHPTQERLVQLGLPYGPKPRLILAHLNGEALRQQSPEIEVEASLHAFVKRLQLDPGGRTTASIKDQLARLAASHITLGTIQDGRAITVNSQVVTSFDVWFPKQGQRVLWPSSVRLSADYFDSLARHAVPLHDQALIALSGNAMALDVYAWLAQRLHRINPHVPVVVPWISLHEQFGWHYERLRDFRRAFKQTVALVQGQYRGARIEMGDRGMTLRCSPSPVKGREWVTIGKR